MMTGKDLVLGLKAKLNKLDTGFNRTLRPEMALLYLNDAHIKLVRAKYSAGGGNPDKTAFEYTQLTTDELNYVTKTNEVDLTVSSDGLNYEVELSEFDDYWYHLRSLFKTKYGNKTQYSSPNKLSLDVINTTISDPFNSSTVLDPVLFFEENKIKSPKEEDFSVEALKMTYLSKPKKFELDVETECPFTDEVIDMATTLILEGWENQRAQSLLAVNKVVKSE